MTAIVLNCPTCQGALTVNEAAILFHCAQCRQWFGVKADGLHQQRLLELKPGKETPIHFYLPFWAFSVETTVSGGDEERRALANEHASHFPLAYVQAFTYHNHIDYFDWGLELTKARWPLEGRTVDDVTIGDADSSSSDVVIRDADSSVDDVVSALGLCTRRAEGCLPFVEAYLMTFIDQVADVTSLAVSCRTVNKGLVAVPFTKRGASIVDCCLGLEAPAVYIDRLRHGVAIDD